MTKLLTSSSSHPLLPLIVVVVILVVALLVPHVAAPNTTPEDHEEQRLQVTTLIFHPDHTLPRIFSEYSFPLIEWAMTQSQREDLVYLAAWMEWFDAFGGYPPVWEVPDCMPPALERTLEAESIDSPEYWRNRIKQIRNDILSLERLLTFWYGSSFLNPRLPEGMMRRYMMHHYPGYPQRDRNFMEQGGSRRTPMYSGYGYSVLGELNIFSRMLRAQTGLDIANIQDVKTLGANRVLSQAHMPRNEMLWELPGSCFCSQYFWSGDVH